METLIVILGIISIALSVTCIALVLSLKSNKNNDFITLLIIFGFTIMMVLEILLG